MSLKLYPKDLPLIKKKYNKKELLAHNFASPLTAQDDIMKEIPKNGLFPLMPFIIFKKHLNYVNKKVNFLNRCGYS